MAEKNPNLMEEKNPNVIIMRNWPLLVKKYIIS